MKFSAFFAFIAMMLLQALVALSGRLVVMRSGGVPDGFIVSSFVVLGAACVFPLVFMWAAERKARRDALPEVPARQFAGEAMVPLLVLLTAVVARFAYPESFIAPAAERCFAQAGIGEFYVAAHWAFFSLVDRRRQSSYYCAAFLTGVLFSESFDFLLSRALPGAPDDTVVAVGYSVTTLVMAAAFAAVVCAALPAWQRRGFDGWLGRGTPGSGRSVGNILCVMAAFYLLNALVQGSFLAYSPSTGLRDNFFLIALAACVALPLLGHALTVNPNRGLRAAVAAVAVVFVVAPAFSTFAPNPVIYRGVHAAAAVAQWLFHISMTLLLAWTVRGKWRIAALILPQIGRTLSLFCIPLLRKTLFLNRDLTLVVAVLAAVGFYALATRLLFRPGGDSAPAPADAAAESADLARLVDVRVRALAGARSFSSRETEVAALLARGMTAAEISEQMELSLNTVNTYIRRILKKCGGIRRKDFVGLAFGKER